MKTKNRSNKGGRGQEQKSQSTQRQQQPTDLATCRGCSEKVPRDTCRVPQLRMLQRAVRTELKREIIVEDVEAFLMCTVCQAEYARNGVEFFPVNSTKSMVRADQEQRERKERADATRQERKGDTLALLLGTSQAETSSTQAEPDEASDHHNGKVVGFIADVGRSKRGKRPEPTHATTNLGDLLTAATTSGEAPSAEPSNNGTGPAADAPAEEAAAS